MEIGVIYSFSKYSLPFRIICVWSWRHTREKLRHCHCSSLFCISLCISAFLCECVKKKLKVHTLIQQNLYTFLSDNFSFSFLSSVVWVIFDFDSKTQFASFFICKNIFGIKFSSIKEQIDSLDLFVLYELNYKTIWTER